jgi:DNA polymerase I-like protein with 3'-5' exonuclease and polymerase domains
LYNELNGAKFYITFEEAKSLYDKYCQEFKVAVDFLRSNGKLAVKQGYLANANGRRRNWIVPESRDLNKFPKGYMDPKYQGILSSIGREGGNFLIQSVNADITKTAMINMRKHIIKNKVRSNIMLQVYDEVVTCTHKDDSEEWKEKKREIMIESAKIWIDSVPIEVDGHVLPYWTK